MVAPFKRLLLAALLAPAFPAFAQQSDEELVKQLANPVASLISVPFQNNFDFRIGPLSEGWKYTLNFQPVIPVKLNQDWNLIIRTIVPYVHQEDVFKGSTPSFEQITDGIPIDLPPALTKRLRGAFDKATAGAPGHVQDGLGDILQSFFFSPSAPVGGWVLGFGPALLYPSATDDLLGSEKWAAGPTGLALRQSGGWTYGILANHLWSFAGNEDRRSVCATYLQPFLSYATKTKTTFGVAAESTYDWNESQWTVPLTASVSQLVKIGKLPVQFSVGGKYYVEGPSGAPEWGLRFTITPLFPTGSRPAPAGDDKSFAK